MPDFKMRTSSGGLRRVEVQTSDTVDDVRRNLQEALRLEGPVKLHFQGMGEIPGHTNLLNRFPHGATFDVDVDTSTADADADADADYQTQGQDQSANTARDHLSIAANIAANEAEQDNEIYIPQGPRVITAGISKNQAKDKSKQKNIIGGIRHKE